jgi:succinoglycan biosynthesis transport protein ExoP
MLLWIPYIAHRKRLALTLPRLALRRSGSALQLSGRNHQIAPWDLEHFIRPFSEALRDRLTLYFQVKHMIHKPKLVAITGCSKGAGTSTLAAGLAAALSETGDGKVLLVDMNVARAEMHPFFHGTPSCSLSEALVGEPTPAGENLYLAVANPPGARQGQIIPKRFYDLVPHLKASDFDYIIFDMPALNQTSITLATAGYMDKVVLVAEAEKSNRQVVRRAYLELASVNANVSAVLNKLRFYAPKFLAVEG